MPPIAQPLIGFCIFIAFAWAISTRRQAVPWRTVVAGIGLQVVLALIILKLPGAQAVLSGLNDVLLAIQTATRSGTALVFGYLGGGPLPFQETSPGMSFVLALQALPIVLVMSALSALLFHLGILPAIVRAFAWALERSMGVGGAVGLSTAANVFVGMVEAPLLIKPYLARVSRGELFIILSAGMAGVAGTVMALYASIIGPSVPGALGHILAASFISAPAAIVFSVLMVPPEGRATGSEQGLEALDESSMGAIARGTAEGLQLLLNIVAMLIVLVALVALVNQFLGALPSDGAPWSLQRLLGLAMAPVVWLVGLPWSEAQAAGSLLGTKTVLNEFIAYLDMAALPESALSAHSRLVMTYALCGFANLGSLGIMIGGLVAMAPARRQDILELAPRTLVSGTLSTLSCACLVNILL